MNGYIKLFRKLTEWQWYGDIPTCRLFIHLLLSASYEETAWRGLRIGCGQYLTSYNDLVCQTALSRMQVQRALRNLRECGSIRSIVFRKKLLVTICHYASYQTTVEPSYSDKAIGRIPSVIRTDQRSDQRTDQRLDTSYIYIKEEKKKRIKEIYKEKARASNEGVAESSIAEGEKVYTEGVEDAEITPAVAQPEEKTSGETRARAKSDEAVAMATAVQQLYNEAAARSNLPKCTKLTARRTEAVWAIAREYDMATIRLAIKKAENSNFLNGRARAEFRASFDWVFSLTNFVKILEGNYDSRAAPTAPGIKNDNNTSNYANSARDDRDAARRERQEQLARRVYTKLRGEADTDANGNPPEIS